MPNFSKSSTRLSMAFKTFTNILKNEEEAVKLSDEHIKQTMNTLLKSSKDQKDLVKIHAEILNVINKFNGSIKDMQLKFAEQYNRLYDVGGERITRLEKSVGELEHNIRIFSESLSKFSGEILEEQKLAMEGFKESLIEGVQAFKKAFDAEAGEAYEDNSALIEGLKQDIDELDKETNEILQTIEKASMLDENA